jgi:hypothetical protein
MGSYYFILTKKLLEKTATPNLDFSPYSPPPGTYIPPLKYTTKIGDWFDSFGLFTIYMLATNPTIFTIYDDRSSIYYD